MCVERLARRTFCEHGVKVLFDFSTQQDKNEQYTNKEVPYKINYMVVYIIKVIGSPITRTFIDVLVGMFVFVLRSFPSKRTYSLNPKRTKGVIRTFVLRIPLSIFARLFSVSAHPHTHVLLKSVSHESDTLTSLNVDMPIFLITHNTQSQHSHLPFLLLDCILFLSCNVCFCILRLCLHLLMFIDLLIDLLAHSLLSL